MIKIKIYSCRFNSNQWLCSFDLGMGQYDYVHFEKWLQLVQWHVVNSGHSLLTWMLGAITLSFLSRYIASLK